MFELLIFPELLKSCGWESSPYCFKYVLLLWGMCVKNVCFCYYIVQCNRKTNDSISDRVTKLCLRYSNLQNDASLKTNRVISVLLSQLMKSLPIVISVCLFLWILFFFVAMTETVTFTKSTDSPRPMTQTATFSEDMSDAVLTFYIMLISLLI